MLSKAALVLNSVLIWNSCVSQAEDGDDDSNDAEGDESDDDIKSDLKEEPATAPVDDDAHVRITYNSF